MTKNNNKGSRQAKKEARSKKGNFEGNKKSTRGEARVVTRGKKGRGKLYDETSMGEEEGRLSKRLEGLGLKVDSVEGDGSCMFRALSSQLFGHQLQRQILRKMVCDELETNEALYSCWIADKPYKRYIRDMRQDSTYGGHLELAVFARISKRIIRVVQHDGAHTIDDSGLGTSISDEAVDKFMSFWASKEKDVTPVGEMLYLVYHTWEHYDSARNLNGPDYGLPKLKPIDSEAPAVREVAKEVKVDTHSETNVDHDSNDSSSAPTTPPKAIASELFEFRDRSISQSPTKSSSSSSPGSVIYHLSDEEDMGAKSDLEASCVDLARKIDIASQWTPSPSSSTFGSPPRGVASSISISKAARADAHPYGDKGRKRSPSPKLSSE